MDLVMGMVAFEKTWPLLMIVWGLATLGTRLAPDAGHRMAEAASAPAAVGPFPTPSAPGGHDAA